ncbi:MAG: GAF and ANTAR domain-containing protein [Nocardioides sp.]
MEPIPETLEAIDELDPYLDDGSLLEQITRMAVEAAVIAPDLVGVSVAAQAHGVTFTLVATDEVTAALDGVQYLASGPCVDGLAEEQGVATTTQDLLSEPRWQAFGRAGAAAGVRSTLTFPIVNEGNVVGTVNIYGGSDDAFTGRHEQLAMVFGAWAPGAVANADLSFSTRRVAESAPELLRDQAQVDAATGILAAARNVDVETAKEHLMDAAQRAGVPLVKLAQAVLEVRNPH